MRPVQSMCRNRCAARGWRTHCLSRIGERMRIMKAIRTSLALVAPALWGACVYDWTWPTPSECSPAEPCGDSEYCLYLDHACGSGEKGTCQPRPANCIEGQGPAVCGCDAQVHANECWAAQEAAVDIAHTDACAGKNPGSYIPCAYVYCTTGEFC